MVGGGNRRDEGSFTVSNTNVFAALESLRKKKKSDKDKASSRGSKSAAKAAGGKSKETEEEKPQVFWAPAPLTVKSWADVDDEDDDDYYATTAPPQAIWAGSGLTKTDETQKPDPVEESESEDELLDEGDDDVEEEHDHESEVQEKFEPILDKPVEASPAPKETERQLSKKERKKKELAELEAILADFGINPKDKVEDEASGDAAKEMKDGQLNGDAEKNAPVESKSAKKKKKKDKASKDVKEPLDQPNSSDAPNGQVEAAGADTGTEQLEEDASAVDMKERLKRVASSKKKKSNKELDAAARAAAVEAAARSARLAAAKKKEKNHYNQQPMR